MPKKISLVARGVEKTLTHFPLKMWTSNANFPLSWQTAVSQGKFRMHTDLILHIALSACTPGQMVGTSILQGLPKSLAEMLLIPGENILGIKQWASKKPFEPRRLLLNHEGPTKGRKISNNNNNKKGTIGYFLKWYYLLLFYFETGFHYVILAGLKPRLALNLQRYTFFCLLSALIKGIYHHQAWRKTGFLFVCVFVVVLF